MHSTRVGGVRSPQHRPRGGVLQLRSPSFDGPNSLNRRIAPMAHRRHRFRIPTPRIARQTVLLPLMALLGCESTPAELALASDLAFSLSELDLGGSRHGTLDVLNTGTQAVGPIELLPSAVRDQADNIIPGSAVLVSPKSIPTLNPGGSASFTVLIEVNGSVQAGTYASEILARVVGEAETTIPVAFQVENTPTAEIEELSITTTVASLRQGDVLGVTAEGRLSGGGATSDLAVVWSVLPAAAGYIDASGQLVGYVDGPITITAEYGGHSASHSVAVVARDLSGSLAITGKGAVDDRFTSDLWVHGDFAYTGTWGRRTVGTASNFGNRLYAWNVSNPAAPFRTDQLTVAARTVNDIKVRADGQLAILTHEGSNDGLNGVTLLDLSDPARPTEIGRYTSGLSSGVHNVWIEGDYAFLVLDGTGSGMRVLDISDPSTPTTVASYYGGQSFLHDIYVRDGLAFLSHWGAGLIILDVGNGIRGGSPTNPVEVSRVSNMGGETHNAWYWPEAGYVFVGEEDFQTPGITRVVDVADLENPEVVATFRVPGTPPHNFWLDEASAVLYLAWYENGLRALDVSGRLMGEIDRQGREIFGELYEGTGAGCATGSGTCTWAPQFHQGRVFVSDMNNGMLVLTPSF